MKRSILLFLCLVCCYAVIAQNKASCALVRLFALRAGTSETAVIDSVRSIYGLTILSRSIGEVNAAGRNKDVPVYETLIYKADTFTCFNGKNTLLRFQFSNGKLYKATVCTQYAGVDYYDLMDNLNTLRTILKASGENEKQTKSLSEKLVSTGYAFSKKRSREKIELEYITAKEEHSIYLLQLTWVNLHNDGIETILY